MLTSAIPRDQVIRPSVTAQNPFDSVDVSWVCPIFDSINIARPRIGMYFPLSVSGSGVPVNHHFT